MPRRPRAARRAGGAVSLSIAPMGVSPELIGCDVHLCRLWFKTVPELAQHAWPTHGIPFSETYEKYEYTPKPGDPGMAGTDATRVVVKEAPMAETPGMVTVPCGKRMLRGQASGGHKAKCKACRAKMDAPAPRAVTKAPRIITRREILAARRQPDPAAVAPPADGPLSTVLDTLHQWVRRGQAAQEAIDALTRLGR